MLLGFLKNVSGDKDEIKLLGRVYSRQRKMSQENITHFKAQ